MIIWGGNYFDLPASRNFIVWDKINIHDGFDMAQAELAWTNIKGNSRIFRASAQRDNTSGGFHPTEKPIKLYTWILKNYANPGDIILDTHTGSGSSLIACEQMGYKYVAFEIDKTYFDKAKKRISDYKNQVSFFTGEELNLFVNDFFNKLP